MTYTFNTAGWSRNEHVEEFDTIDQARDFVRGYGFQLCLDDWHRNAFTCPDVWRFNADFSQQHEVSVAYTFGEVAAYVRRRREEVSL